MTVETNVIPLPDSAGPSEAVEPLGLVLEELRRLRAEVQGQRQQLQELQRQLGRPAPVAVPVEDAARILGCGKTQVFDLLRRGHLRRGRSVGRRTMVTMASLDALQADGAQHRRPRTRRSTPASSQVQDVAAAIRDLAV